MVWLQVPQSTDVFSIRCHHASRSASNVWEYTNKPAVNRRLRVLKILVRVVSPGSIPPSEQKPNEQHVHVFRGLMRNTIVQRRDTPSCKIKVANNSFYVSEPFQRPRCTVSEPHGYFQSEKQAIAHFGSQTKSLRICGVHNKPMTRNVLGLHGRRYSSLFELCLSYEPFSFAFFSSNPFSFYQHKIHVSAHCHCCHSAHCAL